MYTLHDALEQSLPIPQGRYDVPLMIRDALFDRNGQLLYDDGGHSGIFGDVILVNGRPWPVMKVERRKYRFRFLNCSISRGFRFALSTGDPCSNDYQVRADTCNDKMPIAVFPKRPIHLPSAHRR